MEGYRGNNKKRGRDDSDEFDENSPEFKHNRVDSAELESPESVLLDILDDSDTVGDRDSAIQGLDLVIKSFEEEMHVPVTTPASYDVTSQPELGYLLEASDDELGLPPSFSSGDERKVDTDELATSSSDVGGLDGMLGFVDQIPNYDSFEFEFGVESGNISSNNGGDFVTVGGLFDYSDPNEISEFLWLPESLPAL